MKLAMAAPLLLLAVSVLVTACGVPAQAQVAPISLAGDTNVSALEAAERGTFKGTLPDGCTSLQPWIAVLKAALCRDGAHQMLVDAETGLAGLPKASLMRPAALLLLGSAHLLGFPRIGPRRGVDRR